MTAIIPNSIPWREPLQKALAEPDKATLLKHVYATEEALYFRYQEMCLSDGHAAELHEMNLACEDLLRIRNEKLGWPPVRLPNLLAPANAGVLKVPKTDGTEKSAHAS